MRIAIVDLLFRWPPDGGARIDVWQLLQFLGRKHDVRLFCPYVPDDPFGRGTLNGLKNDDISRIERIGSSKEDFIAGKFLNDLERQVEAFCPEKVIITDGWHYKPFVINRLKRFEPIVRLYAHEMLCVKGHGHRYRDNQVCEYCCLSDDSFFRTCQSCMSRWHDETTSTDVFDLEIEASGLPHCSEYDQVVKQALHAASTVIVYNQHEAERIAPFCSNVAVVPGACEAELFDQDATFDFPRAEGGWRFLVSGRCNDYLKGLHVVKEAVSILAENTNQNILVEFTGEGEETDHLKPLGWLPREELLAHMMNMDLTIHPSVWPEPFGMAALESIALGVPVLASDHGGLGDLVRKTKGGWTFTPGDAVSLAEQLRRIIEDPTVLRTAASEGRMNARAFTWEKVFQNSYGTILGN